jgi:hypothetical protein
MQPNEFHAAIFNKAHDQETPYLHPLDDIDRQASKQDTYHPSPSAQPVAGKREATTKKASQQPETLLFTM